MIDPLNRVVDYCMYCLHYISATLKVEESRILYFLKRQVDGLHSTFEAFTGSNAIKLLSSLSTLRDTLVELCQWHKRVIRVYIIKPVTF